MIPAAEARGFGDYLNDLELLDAAGLILRVGLARSWPSFLAIREIFDAGGVGSGRRRS